MFSITLILISLRNAIPLSEMHVAWKKKKSLMESKK